MPEYVSTLKSKLEKFNSADVSVTSEIKGKTITISVLAEEDTDELDAVENAILEDSEDLIDGFIGDINSKLDDLG